MILLAFGDESEWAIHVSLCWCRGNGLLHIALCDGGVVRNQWHPWELGWCSHVRFYGSGEAVSSSLPLGVALAWHIVLWWFVLPLHRSGALFVGVMKLAEVLFRKGFGTITQQHDTRSCRLQQRWHRWEFLNKTKVLYDNYQISFFSSDTKRGSSVC